MRRIKLIEDLVAHLLAAMITLGFFSIILLSLLGFVDLKDPVVSSFVGLAVGYAAGSLNIALARYFKQPEMHGGFPPHRLDIQGPQKPKLPEDL